MKVNSVVQEEDIQSKRSTNYNNMANINQLAKQSEKEDYDESVLSNKNDADNI